ncbi:ABC transporter ATP-binding protein [Carbonactinospora thermoautotrophica]|nr:ABC transporter ATP-binding protein [Carbonactinospora thermoautotrophica]
MRSVEVRGVTKRYWAEAGEAFDALGGVDLEAAAGEFLAILGPSGCGKTTLLRMIAGLEEPTTGEVRVGGRAVTGPGPDRSVVFQQPALLPWRTAAANVAFPLEVAGVPRQERRRRVAELLSLVGLEGFERAYPHELSGGMRQRVDLARALATRPDVLLADEPFGALDAITRNAMQEELLRVWRRDRTTVLFVTHSADEAVFLADRVAVLAPRPGRLVGVVTVDLPRPRDRTSAEFVALRREVLDLLKPGSRGHAPRVGG